IYLFVDDNITAEKEILKHFLRELIPMEIKWVSQASIEMTEDRELMKLMAESGCMGNLIGFDSITTEGLRSYHKAPNLINFNRYEEPIRVLRDYGMLNWAAFVFGNDCDSIDSLKRTVDFAVSNRFSLAYFNLMMPYPGTPIYEQLKKENRLLYDGQWWNHPNYRYNRSAFVPAQMTPDDLSEATIKANRDFYSYTSIGNRLLDLKTNFKNPLHAVVYLYFNLLLKKTGTRK
ncbi:MAG: methylase, partial [Bacteroidota bacterium]|nr:methylase [Bacteroidota bacterium]